MQRVTVTIDKGLMSALDRYLATGGHKNRSEAVRDLVRAGLLKEPTTGGGARPCIAALIYVYDYETRQLSRELLRAHHHHVEIRSPCCTSTWMNAVASKYRCLKARNHGLNTSPAISSASEACAVGALSSFRHLRKSTCDGWQDCIPAAAHRSSWPRLDMPDSEPVY